MEQIIRSFQVLQNFVNIPSAWTPFADPIVHYDGVCRFDDAALKRVVDNTIGRNTGTFTVAGMPYGNFDLQEFKDFLNARGVGIEAGIDKSWVDTSRAHPDLDIPTEHLLELRKQYLRFVAYKLWESQTPSREAAPADLDNFFRNVVFFLYDQGDRALGVTTQIMSDFFTSGGIAMPLEKPEGSHTLLSDADMVAGMDPENPESGKEIIIYSPQKREATAGVVDDVSFEGQKLVFTSKRHIVRSQGHERSECGTITSKVYCQVAPDGSLKVDLDQSKIILDSDDPILRGHFEKAASIAPAATYPRMFIDALRNDREPDLYAYNFVPPDDKMLIRIALTLLQQGIVLEKKDLENVAVIKDDAMRAGVSSMLNTALELQKYCKTFKINLQEIATSSSVQASLKEQILKDFSVYQHESVNMLEQFASLSKSEADSLDMLQIVARTNMLVLATGIKDLSYKFTLWAQTGSLLGWSNADRAQMQTAYLKGVDALLSARVELFVTIVRNLIAREVAQSYISSGGKVSVFLQILQDNSCTVAEARGKLGWLEKRTALSKNENNFLDLLSRLEQHKTMDIHAIVRLEAIMPKKPTPSDEQFFTVYNALKRMDPQSVDTAAVLRKLGDYSPLGSDEQKKEFRQKAHAVCESCEARETCEHAATPK